MNYRDLPTPCSTGNRIEIVLSAKVRVNQQRLLFHYFRNQRTRLLARMAPIYLESEKLSDDASSMLPYGHALQGI